MKVKKIVFYGMEKCEPCRAIAPHVERVAKRFGLEVEKVEDPSSILKEGIAFVPTVCVEHEGGGRTCLTGKENIRSSLERLLKDFE